jgi:succinyl-diaminopimelate desuccinylase
MHIAAAAVPWSAWADGRFGPVRVKDLLAPGRVPDGAEFRFGLTELGPGARADLHRHEHAKIDFVVSGTAAVRIGRERVTLESGDCIYFPPDLPHGAEAVGGAPLILASTYACERRGLAVEWRPVPADVAAAAAAPYQTWLRWSETRPWTPIEPEKGLRIRFKRVMDPERYVELIAGVAELDPMTHYTRHWHDQAELYYILSGYGLVYVEASAHEVGPGSAVYIPARGVHGADSLGATPLRILYVYGCERVGHVINWTPVEEVYAEPRPAAVARGARSRTPGGETIASMRPSSMDGAAALLKQIDERESEFLALVSEITRMPSENPPGDTRLVADHLVAWLRQRGLGPEVVAAQPELPNVVATVAGGGPGRHLILNGHMDTFPVGDRARWTMDPFSGLVADGKIHGRGVSDMKGGLAASVAAFAALAALREAWRGRLTLAAVSDEGTFGPWGANYLVDHGPKLHGDAVIIGEPSSPRTIRFGERGVLWLRIAVRGHSSHAAYPHHGWNAIAAMVTLLGQIKALEAEPWPVPDDFLRTIDAARATTDELLGPGTTEVLSALTISFGTIRGGTKVNLTAESCEAEVDIRLPPGVSVASVLRHVGRIVRSHRGASYEVTRRGEPNYSDPTGELFETVGRAVAQVCGEPAALNIGSPGTDGRVFRRVGIPVAVFGPRPFNLGAPDEYITVRDYLDTIRVHALSALDFLSQPAPTPPPPGAGVRATPDRRETA